MKTVTAESSPSLIMALTKEVPLEHGPDLVSSLPGQYIGKVLEKLDHIKPLTTGNIQLLKCNPCGKKGKYDIGMIAFDIDRYYKDAKKHGSSIMENLDAYIQTTGYFRCKHCHSAGDWTYSSDFLIEMTSMLLMRSVNMENPRLHFGPLGLFDGSRHRFATDSEEYLLKKIALHEDSLLWNKLGNLYNKGGRPELATAAFEQSIRLDPAQVESHFSLGQILEQVHEYEWAAYHFRLTLCYGSSYKAMDAIDLRKMLACALDYLFSIHTKSEGTIQLIPTGEELKAARCGEVIEDIQEEEAWIEWDVVPNQLESFFPIAEMYMGERRKEIPFRLRTLDKHLRPVRSTPIKKKKKKRK
ncbi:lipopolysaccharide assembly protein LapB [Ammoniphilus sp. CFH 90114]|uniref:tetratricopeptide repeat protein n=1 Tax=Ammoniphilus sp. CFH 90114 TaxID=2493665 RepID=UPI00100E9352|nr:tetratricopeptide repeat protein [Ammoniphilus sp. CFH 90114]RXT00961.1 tetratricopeptide repeat protein [Ammoniphilus sp. CFH 90114]